jgi:hypothetical protein
MSVTSTADIIGIIKGHDRHLIKKGSLSLFIIAEDLTAAEGLIALFGP